MNTETEIIPAILPQDFIDLEEKVSLVKGATKAIQVDICDGHFVPSFTWPYKKKDNSFELMIREDEALPAWDEVDYEFDLMVDHPEKVVDDWVSIGAARIVIHVEAKGDIKEAIGLLAGRVDIGLAINIDTPIDELEPYAEDIQFIQCMGIDHVGFQGQAFDEKVIDKIRAIKEAFPNLPVSVDGGVSLDNAGALLNAGAERLVVGSAILNAENPLDVIYELQGL